MLEDVGFGLNLLQIFVQHCATLLAQRCTMLASLEEQALTNAYNIVETLLLKVTEDDAVMAILLYEESITARVGMFN